MTYYTDMPFFIDPVFFPIKIEEKGVTKSLK